MNVSKIIVIGALLLLSSCLPTHGDCADSKTQLNKVIENWENYESFDYDVHPLGLFTKERYQKDAEFAQLQLDQLECVKEDELSESEQISLALIRFQLQDEIDTFEFENYLNPLLSDSGFHTDLPHQVKTFRNLEDYDRYLKKLNVFPEFVDQHIILMREGLEKHISQPKEIFKDFEDSYNVHIVENSEDSFYFSPFKNFPGSISESQQDSLKTVAKQIISERVTPQFSIIKAFFEEEYFPKTRAVGGVLHQDNGKAYYENRIRFYTTLDLTPLQVHEKGLAEVKRIREAMEEIIKEVEYEGDFDAFLTFLRTDSQFYAATGEDLLKEARNISKKIDAQLPAFFVTLPRKPYGVAPVPDVIAPKYTGGRYIPTSKNSTRPGYYWVNTYDLPSRPLYILPALTLHEAVPGHHLQMSLNNELGEHIPQFRRNLYLSAYGEGWGLYAEYLGNDMDIYETPYEHFGKYTYEMWRACRLVIDTGIHAMGWTREQSVEYLKSNTALSLHEVNTEIDRYISWPGQAVSYKIGELKIRELRSKAAKQLQSKFDIREFHEILLEEGTVTLTIMEKRVENYIAKILNE